MNFNSLIPKEFKLNLSNRQKIEIIEYFLNKHTENELNKCELTHEIKGNYYIRTMSIPKDMIVVGNIHKHMNTISLIKGDMSYMADEGMKRIKSGFIGFSKAGVKRIVYAHEDSVCQTVHDITGKVFKDFDELERLLIEKSDLSWIDGYLEVMP